MEGASDGRLLCSKAAQREPVVATRIKLGPPNQMRYGIYLGESWGMANTFS